MFILGQNSLTVDQLVQLGKSKDTHFKIDAKALKHAESYHHKVEAILEKDVSVYGINTGFGFMSDVKIAKDDLQQLQLNLIRSHACGVGKSVPNYVVKSLLVLRAHTFLIGNSGVSTNCLNTILSFLNNNLLPKVPSKGSVGASGDLAPLAHLALGLIGEGDIHYKGEFRPAESALSLASVVPMLPKAKEGLSLINGTQFMSTLGSFALWEGKNLVNSADIIAALSLDAIRGTSAAFDSRIHNIRPHSGQKLVAKNLRKLLDGPDEIQESHRSCDKIQDAYSFRCIPQVHGASRDALDYVSDKLNIELNSITDNPLIFENGDIISGGNFHGQPIAMSLDFLGIAIAEMGSISERRTEKMTNPGYNGGLPAFVTNDGGLNSGYMIPHVVTAALVSENKILTHPACVDSIPTSADKEDHVSMGPIAANKARVINENVSHILAIELLAACQAIDLLSPLKPTALLQVVYNKVREVSPYMGKDRSLHVDIEQLSQMIINGEFVSLLEAEGISLNA